MPDVLKEAFESSLGSDTIKPEENSMVESMRELLIILLKRLRTEGATEEEIEEVFRFRPNSKKPDLSVIPSPG